MFSIISSLKILTFDKKKLNLFVFIEYIKVYAMLQYVIAVTITKNASKCTKPRILLREEKYVTKQN